MKNKLPLSFSFNIINNFILSNTTRVSIGINIIRCYNINSNISITKGDLSMTQSETIDRKMIKIVYFDEVAASDYITIHNGGQIDWSTKENKEKLAKLMAELDVQAKGGINLFSIFKTSASGHANTAYDSTTTKLIESTLTNTLLTDYIEIAKDDSNVRKFHDDSIYPPANSISMYKMFASYLNVVPKDEIPINIDALNEAMLGERGYYQMLLNNEIGNPTSVLRFNIKAFKNNYTLSDLSKMRLTYFGVKVGECTEEQLSIEKEFEIGANQMYISASEIVSSDESTTSTKQLEVYDIILAGVLSNG